MAANSDSTTPVLAVSVRIRSSSRKKPARQRSISSLVIGEDPDDPKASMAAHLPKSKVVKAFNHIHAASLPTEGQPPGTKNRRALVIAGDDEKAKAMVSALIDKFGFDVADA